MYIPERGIYKSKKIFDTSINSNLGLFYHFFIKLYEKKFHYEGVQNGYYKNIDWLLYTYDNYKASDKDLKIIKNKKNVLKKISRYNILTFESLFDREIKTIREKTKEILDKEENELLECMLKNVFSDAFESGETQARYNNIFLYSAWNLSIDYISELTGFEIEEIKTALKENPDCIL